MKKIIILVLAIMLILPSFPAFAANPAKVVVDNFADISGELLVSVETDNAAFCGAEVELGDIITKTIDGTGKGKHTASLNLSGVETTGNVPLTVTVNYGSSSEVIEKTVCLSKMKTTTVETTFGNSEGYNTVYNLTSADKGFAVNEWAQNADDEDAYHFRFTKSITDMGYTKVYNADIRLGVTDTTNLRWVADALFVIEGEVMFQNDIADTETKEAPMGSLFLYFRQNKTYAKSGYPLDSSSATYTPETEVASREAFPEDGKATYLFQKGKLSDGSSYYTNTWYKYLIVTDAATRLPNGLVAGGQQFYIAEQNEDGTYGDYRLVNNAPNFAINSITSVYWLPRLGDVTSKGYTMNFKNFKIHKKVPLKSWYLNSAEYESGKLNLTFSEDMGELTGADVKIFNKFNTPGEEMKVTSIQNLGDGEYEVEFATLLNYGREYDVMITNNFTSPSGAVGFTEPDEDENNDGMWLLTSFKAPDYALNISSVSNGEDVLVEFENNNTTGKNIVVTWFNDNKQMVDFAIYEIDENTSSPLAVQRTNSAPASSVYAYVIDISENGAMNLYDVN